jgi:hypothetical protein
VSGPPALPTLGDLVTSRELAGRGTFVLHSYCAEGELRQAVLLPIRVAAALAPGERAPAEHSILVAPSSLTAQPWAVAAPSRAAPSVQVT